MKKLSLFSMMFFAVASCFIFSACGSNVTLTINFDSNGGTSCKSGQYVVGKSFDIPDDPSKEGYVFGGWYTDNNKWNEPLTVSSIINFPLSKSIPITAYAKWLNINYTINFDTNGGNAVEDLFVDNVDIPLPEPTKSGYNFSGWYVDSELKNEFSTKMPLDLTNNQITVYAKWERNLKVVFHFNNGADDVTRYFDNDSFALPQNITKEHFTFIGWSFDDETNIVYDQYFISNYEKDGILNLYAVWEEDPISKVEIYDKGNIKDFYHWGEEVDVSQTKLKLTYQDGTSRIAFATESKEIRESKYYAKGSVSKEYSSEEPRVYYTTSFYLNYKASTESYVVAYVNIYQDFKIVGIENYTDTFNYEDVKDGCTGGESIITDDTKIILEDLNGDRKEYNLKEFYGQNKEDFTTYIIGGTVSGSRYQDASGTYYYGILDPDTEEVCFENNYAFINRELKFVYRTETIYLPYKIMLGEIESVNFVIEDFYPGDWLSSNYSNIGVGSVGGVYKYKTRTGNVTLLANDETKSCVRVQVKLKSGHSVLSNIEDIFNSNQLEILNDIYFEENIARATIKINGYEYEINSGELETMIKQTGFFVGGLTGFSEN